MNNKNGFASLLQELSHRAGAVSGLSSALDAVEEVDRLLDEKSDVQSTSLRVPYLTAEAVVESDEDTD